MRFEIFEPCDALKGEIASFVVSENEGNEVYHVLPDTALVLGFQYNGRIALVTDNLYRPMAAAGITGLQNSVRSFKSITSTGSVLVKFKPGGAASFFRLPLHELFEQSLSLESMIDQKLIDIVEQKLEAAVNDIARIKIVESFLLSIRKVRQRDILVEGATALIQQARGNIRISDLAKQLLTSPSPLEKRFRSIIGASPKKYASIVRFKSIINASKDSCTPAARAYKAGYFDQAHFIRDFKRFTGQTPEEYFQRLNSRVDTAHMLY